MIDLKFANVSKRYRIRQDSVAHPSEGRLTRTLKGMWKPRKEFWAVRDVSFDVERGEVLGIIGHNGAGKSTILKMLASITPPTSGEIIINGRLSALIEVGSGFHPELTGRENIFLNGSILGMTRREIATKLERIVEFAGIQQFVDTPVKRYSSGMYVRLGFSIAAHLDPDILLLDEVLAVGDAAFQAKCLKRIAELKESGTTIVFISHDLGAVERVCSRAILLDRGEIAAVGTANDVITKYQRADRSAAVRTSPEAHKNASEREVEITSVEFYDGDGRAVSAVRTGEELIARLTYRCDVPVKDAVFEFFVLTLSDQLICHFVSDPEEVGTEIDRGVGLIEVKCEEFGLHPDIYYVDVTIRHATSPPGSDIDWRHRFKSLRVDPGKQTRGIFYLPHTWSGPTPLNPSSLENSQQHSENDPNPSMAGIVKVSMN
ncbi:MAG: ABC transporter ATP-binding protein [Blastocatellia bacterium]|nr:ABC transporter ATP-binding protein [Blastocatellia bacterium]